MPFLLETFDHMNYIRVINVDQPFATRAECAESIYQHLNPNGINDMRSDLLYGKFWIEERWMSLETLTRNS